MSTEAVKIRNIMKESFYASKDKVFNKLPDVLIQDSKTLKAYLVPASKLKTYSTDSKKIGSLPQNTVTFLIPDEDYIGEIPIAFAYEKPSVLIQFPKEKSSYYLSNNDMKKYEVSLPDKLPEDCLSFVIPSGDDFMEDVPDMSPAMLQSNEVNPTWPY